MNSYELILKVMRVVDKRNPHASGLPLKDIITFGNVHVGLFDPASLADRNIMGFTLTGEFLWLAEGPPVTHERFSRSWKRMEKSSGGHLVAISAAEMRYVIDPRTGNIRPYKTKEA